jgi:hypothetical protein
MAAGNHLPRSDQFDADREGVDVGAAFIARLASVPGRPIERGELSDQAVAVDDQMRTGLGGRVTQLGDRSSRVQPAGHLMQHQGFWRDGAAEVRRGVPGSQNLADAQPVRGDRESKGGGRVHGHQLNGGLSVSTWRVAIEAVTRQVRCRHCMPMRVSLVRRFLVMQCLTPPIDEHLSPYETRDC